MSKLLKLYEKVKNNPKAVRFDEIDKLLLTAGFEKWQSKKGSSHFNYVKGECKITVPFKQPHILQIYIKQALIAIEKFYEELI